MCPLVKYKIFAKYYLSVLENHKLSMSLNLTSISQTSQNSNYSKLIVHSPFPLIPREITIKLSTSGFIILFLFSGGTLLYKCSMSPKHPVFSFKNYSLKFNREYFFINGPNYISFLIQINYVRRYVNFVFSVK